MHVFMIEKYKEVMLTSPCLSWFVLCRPVCIWYEHTNMWPKACV